MAIDLGKWSWAANMALDWGAPALAAAFGVPGPVSAFAIGALKKALGLAPNATDADVKAAVDADPETAKTAFQDAQSEVTAKYQYLTALSHDRADVAKTNITEVNQTIRDENARGVSWWHWRHLGGYVVIWIALVVSAGLIKAMFWGIPSAADLAALIGAITPIFVALCALNGYVAQDSSAVKVAAMTGQPVPGILATAIKGITGGKK